MGFDLKIENPEVLEQLRDAHLRLIPEIKKGVSKAVAMLAGEARELVSGKVLNVRTGRLRSSIIPSPPRAHNGVVEGQYGSNVDYAPIHELGGEIKVPEIRPSRAKALRFEVDGHVVFAK